MKAHRRIIETEVEEPDWPPVEPVAEESFTNGTAVSFLTNLQLYLHRTPLTAYNLGDIRVVNSILHVCVVAGLTGSWEQYYLVAPNELQDGTVVWRSLLIDGGQNLSHPPITLAF